MNYQNIKPFDATNGKFIRVSIWFSGCKFRCNGCFNHEAWDFNSGKPFDDKAKAELFKYLSNEHIHGLSILGGEPLHQDLDEMFQLVKEVKTTFPDKDIWLWTGYYLNELNDKQKEIINLCDYVVDGRFDINKSSFKLHFRGSSNQTIWKNENNKWLRSQLNDL